MEKVRKIGNIGKKITLKDCLNAKTRVSVRLWFLPMMAALLGSVLVDPFLVLEDAEAEMDL